MDSRCAVGALIAVWTVAVAFGWWLTVRYEFATVGQGEMQFVRSWPKDSALPLATNRPTLVLFLHPKCPCTRATLHELDRLVATIDGRRLARPNLQIVATVPADAENSWWDTKSVSLGEQIAGGDVFVDRSGREAARFGVSTSGTLLLFDEHGHRLYGGGITISRGHEGRSVGGDRLLKLVAGHTGSSAEMPVFGCRLCLPESELQVAAPTPERPQTIHARSVF